MQTLTTIQQLSVAIVPVVLAITVHEAAHGLVADKLGDKTARAAGRVSLNPFKHIDLIGTVILPLLLFATTGFMFGWAKPVPVNWRNFAKPRRDTALVSAAGPFSNFIMLIGWSLLLAVPQHLPPDLGYIGNPVYFMAIYGILINAVLIALNLLPLLPLDGGRILHAMLPFNVATIFEKTERWGLLILVVLLVSGVLSGLLGPFVEALKGFSVQIAGIFS